MNNNQKMLLGVGVLAVAGYMLWQQSQKKTKSFVSRKAAAPVFAGNCGKGTGFCCNARDYDTEAKKFNCCRGFQEAGTAKMGCPSGGGFADYGEAMAI